MERIAVTTVNINGQPRQMTCLLENGYLLEAVAEKRADAPRIGDIYIGRVQNVVKNLHAAFVEIMPGKCCYLPLKPEEKPFFVRKMPSDHLVCGDELLVQIKRDALKTKEPAVTANLNFPGRYLVLTMAHRTLGISSRIKRNDRARFHELLDDAVRRFSCGIIVRTNAQDASDDEIREELRYLVRQYQDVLAHAPSRILFSRVYAGKSEHMRYVEGAYPGRLEEIVTDDRKIFEELIDYQQRYRDYQPVPVRFYDDADYPMAKLLNLERQLERALQKTVWLKSGGYLVIEPTEALTVIDVNTGKSRSKKNPEEHFLKINKEAAEEIARQLRLRNISGIVIVDFINLKEEAHVAELMHVFREKLKQDPVPATLEDMTRLNLVELTRKKVLKTLKEQLTE